MLDTNNFHLVQQEDEKLHLVEQAFNYSCWPRRSTDNRYVVCTDDQRSPAIQGTLVNLSHLRVFLCVILWRDSGGLLAGSMDNSFHGGFRRSPIRYRISVLRFRAQVSTVSLFRSQVSTRYFPPQQSKNLDLGFPAGRLHQTERAGIFHFKKVKTLILDSPKGDYTRRKGLVFSTLKTKTPWFCTPRRATTPDGQVK